MSTTTTIGTASRNYSTIAAWMAAWTAGGWIGQCYNDSEFTTSSTTVLNGFTGTSANYTTLQTATGQSFRDNAGASTNALTYNQANGVGIRKTSNYNSAISVGQDFVTVQYLQISGGSDGYAFAVNSGALNATTLDSCICLGTQGGKPAATVSNGGGTASPTKNCLFLQKSTTGYGVLCFTGMLMQDCTIVAPSNGVSTNPGIEQNYAGTYSVSGCVVCGFSAWGQSARTYTGDYNSTDASTGPPGSHSLTSQTYANMFQSTLLASPDYRQKSGSPLIGVGYGAGPTVDIIGTARGASPDIGAWQYVTGPALSTVHTLTTTDVGP